MSIGLDIVRRVATFKRPNETHQAFALRIGINPMQWTNWLLRLDAGRDEFEPKLSTIVKVAERLGVEPIWLVFGNKDGGVS